MWEEQLVYDFTLNRQVYHSVLTESQLFSSSLEVQDVSLPYPHARLLAKGLVNTCFPPKRSITQDGAQLFPVKLFLTILCLLDRRLEHIMTSCVILFQVGTSKYSKHSEVLELAFHMYTVNPLKRETCSFLPPEITHVCL